MVVGLFESPQRLEAFLTEAREAKALRVAKAELAAVDADLLRYELFLTALLETKGTQAHAHDVRR